MTNKHDFKAAENMLELWNGKDDLQFSNMVLNKHKEAIQTALRIADRLRGGEVSDEMMEAGSHFATENLFKAMATQMIKEEQSK